jgi:hypothetical protein
MDDLKTNPDVGGVGHRKLRIAWSVAWAILCVLFVALWWRSYWWVERIHMPTLGNQAVVVGAAPGTFVFQMAPYSVLPAYLRYPADEWLVGTTHSRVWGKFDIRSNSVVLPYWLLVVTTAGVATIPWLRQLPHQFSLRTLLIAMTFMAVVLGAIVFSMQ